MKITIRCYARFRDAYGDEQEIDIPEGSTIKDAIITLAGKGSDSELLIDLGAKIRSYVMIMYGNTRISPIEAENTILTDGDVLILFPPVSGG